MRFAGNSYYQQLIQGQRGNRNGGGDFLVTTMTRGVGGTPLAKTEGGTDNWRRDRPLKERHTGLHSKGITASTHSWFSTNPTCTHVSTPESECPEQRVSKIKRFNYFQFSSICLIKVWLFYLIVDSVDNNFSYRNANTGITKYMHVLCFDIGRPIIGI